MHCYCTSNVHCYGRPVNQSAAHRNMLNLQNPHKLFGMKACYLFIFFLRFNPQVWKCKYTEMWIDKDIINAV